MTQLKLKILSRIATRDNVAHVMKELQFHIWSTNQEIGRVAAESLAILGQWIVPDTAEMCIRAFCYLIAGAPVSVAKAAIEFLPDLLYYHPALAGDILPKYVLHRCVYSPQLGEIGFYGVICSCLTVSNVEADWVNQVLQLALEMYDSFEDVKTKAAILELAAVVLARQPYEPKARARFLHAISRTINDLELALSQRSKYLYNISRANGIYFPDDVEDLYSELTMDDWIKLILPDPQFITQHDRLPNIAKTTSKHRIFS